MKHRLFRLHVSLFCRRHFHTEEITVALLVVLLLASPAAAAMRFQERSLYMNSTDPGATTSYTIAFRYMSPVPVGSVDMLFCIDPIPYHPCDVPPGLDASNATLSDQTGETGFSIASQSTNHILLSRPSSLVTSPPSSYTLDNVINPTDTSQSFSIRLRSHQASDGSGPQIDFGSVKGQVSTGIMLETQVPPMLVFCAAGQVAENCGFTNENYYSDMGELSDKSTLKAQSQMAVGTNASGGFVITANGASLSAGTNVIDPLDSPTISQKGTNQFGINLVANTAPEIGGDPEGTWTNAVPAPGYDTPDHYKFVDGEVIAHSPNVSLIKRFTISYVVNSSKDLRPGIYTTTITYIASGRF